MPSTVLSGWRRILVFEAQLREFVISFPSTNQIQHPQPFPTSQDTHEEIPRFLGLYLLLSSHRFHYAARIWDGVKKSSALAEYSRLLA